MSDTQQNTDTSALPRLRMQKMYVKDLSFENPNAPDIYLERAEKPGIETSLQLKHKPIRENHHEVSLGITVKAAIKGEEEKAMFVLELEHAAVFFIENIPEEHLRTVLEVDCPTLLFPFTRQVVSQLAIDGGFAPFLMDPINFMGAYQNVRKKEEEEKKKEEQEEKAE